jgi:hypothetical protein
LADASKLEREDQFSLNDFGPWLSDTGRITLDAGECTGPLLAMGSYRRGQAETVVIEVD